MPKVFVDLYDVTPQVGVPWSYNQFNTITQGQLSASLVDDTNTPTGWTLDLINADFNGKTGAAGTSVGATVWPDDVHNYHFFSNGSPQFQIGGLTPGETFTLELAGHVAQSDRPTDFTVTPSNEGTLRYPSSGTGNAANDPVVFTGTVGGGGTILIEGAVVNAFWYVDGFTLDAQAGGTTKQGSVRLADLSGNDRANVATVPWAWYDGLPVSGLGPTDTGIGSTDGLGNMMVNIPNSALTAGQVGYLLIDTGAWQSIHAVTVTES